MFCHIYAFGNVLSVWAGCNNMFFCHPYAFGYVLSVWAGCSNMFFVNICVWLCLKCVGRL